MRLSSRPRTESVDGEAVVRDSMNPASPPFDAHAAAAVPELAASASPSSFPITVIEPRRNWSLGIRALWSHRELTYFLIWRDIKLRYKQTFFGAGWALIQPILLMGVFGLFFGRLAGLPSDGLPYSIFVLAALVPWTFFSNALAASSRSVVASNQVVSKVYFPRLIIPVAAAAAFLIDLALAFGFLVMVEPFWGIYPTWRFVFIPPLAALALLTTLCLGVWLSALNVRYRDIIYTVPFLIQALMFASPIGYPSTLIPANLRALYGLNPLAGLIEGFRWASAGASTNPWSEVMVSFTVTVILLVLGLVYFARSESSFADII
jgi:homopolymeric O-antigen transport system permease protein